MTPKAKNIILITLCSLSMLQCKDRYTSPYVSPATGYLVVEGFIANNGPTLFTLSRTIPLTGSATAPKESGAALQVEGDDNSTYSLKDQGKGVYGGDTLKLNPLTKYRLRIHTSNNKDYLSDYVPFKASPAIDSISWKYGPGRTGVDIFVNTHDAAAASHYYQWDYVETWHYRSAEYSFLIFKKDSPYIFNRNANEFVYDCWRTNISTAMLLGTTTKLSEDVVSLQRLTHIEQDAQQLAIKYSILVHQHTLTEEAYNYLTLMQKNSESLGSIFDAQPSSLKGNIHCLTNTTEQVLGFVSAGTSVEQRIFIDHAQLPDWNYYLRCSVPDTVIGLDSMSIWDNFNSKGYIPIELHYTGPIADGYTSNFGGCIDCRQQGGTTTKPSFWQD